MNQIRHRCPGGHAFSSSLHRAVCPLVRPADRAQAAEWLAAYLLWTVVEDDREAMELVREDTSRFIESTQEDIGCRASE